MAQLPQSSGYSNTPLAKKLGIKPGFKIMLINEPAHYFDLFTDMPTDLQVINDESEKKNLIHFFTTQKQELIGLLSQLKSQIKSDGTIWVSWPKKASK
jgi:hypothetical protein